MALDDRQQGIREGAGLEESRLNTEFIDWLKRWGSTLLLVFAVIAAGYALYQRYKMREADKRDQAFVALEASIRSSGIPSPASLKALADEYPNVPGVRYIALLKAADAHLAIARVGVKVGSTPDKDGLYAPADLLSDAERNTELDEAASTYTSVLSMTEKTPGLAIHALGAAYGLAAVAESKGQADQAKAHYERAASIADAAGIKQAGDLARKWASDQASLASAPKLLAKSQLVKLPWADAKPAETLTAPGLTPPPAGSVGREAPSPAPDATPASGEKPAAPIEKPAEGAPAAPANPAPSAPAPANPAPAQPPKK